MMETLRRKGLAKTTNLSCGSGRDDPVVTLRENSSGFSF
jgi:hypothetical protein